MKTPPATSACTKFTKSLQFHCNYSFSTVLKRVDGLGQGQSRKDCNKLSWSQFNSVLLWFISWRQFKEGWIFISLSSFMDGQGRSRKDCRKLSWSPRKTLAFSRNLFFTNSFSIPWSKIKTWKLMTIRTLCFSNTSSPTIVRISSPTAPTSPPWKNAQGKNYAFGDDLPSGCQGARTTLHGSSSAPAPSSFFISDDIFQYFRCVSNSQTCLEFVSLISNRMSIRPPWCAAEVCRSPLHLPWFWLRFTHTHLECGN